jgi:hypothetical protein
MKKFTKILPALAVASTLATSVLVGQVSADPVQPETSFTFEESSDAQGAQKVELLNGLYVSLPYDSQNFDIVRTEDDNEVHISVTEKATGQEVASLGELKNKNSTNSLTRAASGYYEDNTVYQDYKDGFVVARLYAVVNCYFGGAGSFNYINSVKNTYWSAVGDGSWNLVDTHASSTSTTGKFPAVKVQISGTATVDTVKTESGGIGLGDLGYTRSQDMHYRKAISQSYYYQFGLS